MIIVCFIFNFSFSFINSDDDTDCKRLFEQGKHLSKQDLEVLREDAANGGQWKLEGDENSNLSFEREMENEARNHVNGVHVNAPTTKSEIFLQRSTLPSSTATSSSATCNPVASTSKTKEEFNDELLYDPDEDDRDQKWADAHRALHSAPPPPPGGPRGQGTGTFNQRPLNEWSKLKKRESDATLNCPCCLTLLCMDCQRHALYKTQYRAMFVINCRIDYKKKLLHRDKEQKRQPFKRSKKQKKNSEDNKLGEGMSTCEQTEAENSTQSFAESDLYHPVHCSSCNTQVALYDINEVYHFFSVLASH